MLDYYQKLIANKITPNGLCQLYMFEKNIYYHNYLNANTELAKLANQNFIAIRKDFDMYTAVDFNQKYEITIKGSALLNQMEGYIIPSKIIKKKISKKELYETWMEHIEEYRLLFPKGSSGGKPLRSNAKDCFDRFLWFFDNYPQFSWENIKKGTVLYLASQNNDNSNGLYIRRASYFIKKQDLDKSSTSDLADWCQMAQEGAEPEEQIYFPTKIV